MEITAAYPCFTQENDSLVLKRACHSTACRSKLHVSFLLPVSHQSLPYTAVGAYTTGRLLLIHISQSIVSVALYELTSESHQDYTLTNATQEGGRKGGLSDATGAVVTDD